MGASTESSGRLCVVPSDEDEGQRLDRYLAGCCDDLSRSRIQGLIEDGAVSVNERPSRSSYRLKAADVITVTVPEPTRLEVQPEEIAVEVTYEDADVLVVDKPAGMIVHPTPGSRSGTLVNALLHRCRDLSGINGVLRPGIVHRLDRDTTGLMVVAKNDAAHRGLAEQLEARKVKRIYTAVVWGGVGDGCVDAPLGRHSKERVKMAVRTDGRRAVTHFRTVESFPFLSLLELRLETGRTHQIRVHMQHLGHPIFADPVYGGRSREHGVAPQYRLEARALLRLLDRQALHARSLGFDHPITGRPLSLESQLPSDMAMLLSQLRSRPPS